ncbi:ArtI protein, partial [Burkholderia territorii]
MKTFATLATLTAAMLCCAAAQAQGTPTTAAPTAAAGSRLDDVVARGT